MCCHRKSTIVKPKPKCTGFPPTSTSSSSSSATGPVRSKPSYRKQHRVTSYFCLQGYCCQSKSVEDDDVREYQCQQAKEAGEEFNSQLEWLSNELLEENSVRAPGSNKGVSQSSPGEYFAPTGISDGWPINIEFIQPARGGFVPDVRCCYGDVRSSLVGPGVTGFQEEEQPDHVEDSRSGRDCHH